MTVTWLQSVLTALKSRLNMILLRCCCFFVMIKYTANRNDVKDGLERLKHEQCKLLTFCWELSKCTLYLSLTDGNGKLEFNDQFLDYEHDLIQAM